MSWWAAGLAYLAVHGMIFIVVVRRASPDHRERLAFRLHAGSFVGLAAVVAVALLVGGRVSNAATMVGLLATHAVFSMSWLEVWGLSDGGYHLALLSYIHRTRLTEGEAQAWGRELGHTKKQARLDSLARLGLIAHVGGEAGLTRRGRLVARGLRVLERLPGGVR